MHQNGDKPHPGHGRTGPLAKAGASAALLLSLIAGWSTNSTAAGDNSSTRFGFTPFPYDSTVAAINRTQSIVEESGNLYALHFDGCIPWKQLLADKPFPRFFQDDWNRLKANIPDGHAVYVGIAPLAKDRRSIAPACGSSHDDTTRLPGKIRNKGFDNTDLMNAYLRYVQRAVDHFNPDFLNIGIEVDGLASHSASDWSRFETMFDHVRAGIQKAHPDLPIGVSMNPQMLMQEKIGKRAKGLVERSDYFGMSFYPYASPMAERYGAPPLGKGDKRWSAVFDWARRYTDKPIALCETGFITEEVYLKEYDLRMSGDIDSQTGYVRALVERARQDDYLFVVWFLSVDYDMLYAKMPEHPGKEVNLLWRNAGLFEGDLEPKPAFAEWMRGVGAKPAKRTTSAKAPAVETPTPAPAGGVQVGFRNAGDLFGTPGDEIKLDKDNTPPDGGYSMRWSYKITKDWKWSAREVDGKMLSESSQLSMWIRSDREGPLFLNVEESSGESFFAILPVEPGWKKVDLRLDELSVDPAKRRNGKLEPAKISKLVLADPGPEGSERSGRRTVWVADLVFE